MSRTLVASFAAALLATAPLCAQPIPPEAFPGLPPGYQQMMTGAAAAQAAAVRPGDEALSCAAIEKELVATMSDPAMKAYQVASGAALNAALGAAPVAESPEPNNAALTAALAGGGPFAPPALPEAFPGAVPTAAQQAQMMAAVEAQATAETPVLPLLMRSQRLAYLAVVKGCAAVAEGAGPFGLEPAGAAR